MLYFPISFPCGYFLFAKEEEFLRAMTEGEIIVGADRRVCPLPCTSAFHWANTPVRPNGLPTEGIVVNVGSISYPLSGTSSLRKRKSLLSDNIAKGVQKQHTGELGFLFYTILYKHRRPGNCPADG